MQTSSLGLLLIEQTAKLLGYKVEPPTCPSVSGLWCVRDPQGAILPSSISDRAVTLSHWAVLEDMRKMYGIKGGDR